MRPNLFRRLLWILGVTVGVTAVALGVLIFRHERHESRERERLSAAADKGPRVYVAAVEKTPGDRTVTLPGDVRAYNQAAIYAKVQGYVREVRVDKGQRVIAGQVLGIIESPETDQQVAAARTDLALKRRTTSRTRALAESGIVSQQDVEVADADLAQSGVTLKRLQALQDYQVLRAPFDGVVTSRNVDPGALVSASSTGLPLMEIADPSLLRITVYVGQDIAAFLKVGDAAEVIQDEHPERMIKARVTRLSDAFDPRTRTMLAEIVLENHERTLVPGVFVHVTLHVKSREMVSVPTEALFVRGDKTMVAVVKDQRVELRPVEPGLNDGKRVQLKTDLPEGTLVALNLPIELGNDSNIQPEKRPQREENAQATGGSGEAGKGEGADKQLGRLEAQPKEEGEDKGEDKGEKKPAGDKPSRDK